MEKNIDYNELVEYGSYELNLVLREVAYKQILVIREESFLLHFLYLQSGLWYFESSENCHFLFMIINWSHVFSCCYKQTVSNLNGCQLSFTFHPLILLVTMISNIVDMVCC